MTPPRLTYAVVIAAALAEACGGGDTGTPAEPGPLESLLYDGGVTRAEASPPAPPTVLLAGTVRKPGVDAGASGAFVVAEVGGLGPDGGTATLDTDTAIRYGNVTGAGGAFGLAVPAGTIGLRVFDPDYLESKTLVMTAPSRDAAPATTTVSLVPLPATDGGKLRRPTTKGLTISSAIGAIVVTYVVPSEPVAFAADVAAGSTDDPLSGDVILVQPETGWAGALVPPAPAVPDGPYPNGVYSLLVAAPAAVGVYTYTLLAASKSGVTSEPASVVLHVTATGTTPLFDAGTD